MEKNRVFVEKYRPDSFDDIILEQKNLIENIIKSPKEIPHLIFHSNKPGTGKTSCAKLMIRLLDCDYLMLNSSDERGIDTIREKISIFSRTLSLTDDSKKCIFLDESEAMTKPAQDCLRNLMETYSDNCFFIFSCNDLGKIIEPIRSRCMVINFDKPNREQIFKRVNDICHLEEVEHNDDVLSKIVDYYYPDIRSVVMAIQKAKIEDKELCSEESEFLRVWEILQKKDIPSLYDLVYSGELDLLRFNNWLFQHLFNNYSVLSSKYGVEKIGKIGLLLAEVEKSYAIGVNIPIVFLANMTAISNLI